MALVEIEKKHGHVVRNDEYYSERDYVDPVSYERSISIRWGGSRIEKKGKNKANCQVIIATHQCKMRQFEISTLLGDLEKTNVQLG